MKLAQVTDDDLLMLAEWVKGEPWNLVPVPNGFKDAIGYIVRDENEALACVYIYTNGSGYCSLEWFSRNPNVGTEIANKAAVFLIENVTEAVKQTSVHCAVFYTRSKAISDIFRLAGFRSKRNFIQMTKVLTKEEVAVDESPRL